MIAGPNGTQVIMANDLMRAIPMRRQLLQSAGHRATTLIGFEEDAMTDRYSLVRAEWRAGGEPRIVLYMNQHDIVPALREQAPDRLAI
jgi:hypothetical protein